MDSFRSDLKCLPIYNLNLDDPDEIVYHYNTDLSDLLDKHAPERTHTVTLRPHSPWFDDSLRKLKTEKRQLELKWMKSGLEIQKLIFINHMTEYYAVVKATKTGYYKNKIADADQNRLFKVIDSFFHVEKAVSLPHHDCDLTLANMFGKLFLDKIQDICNQIVGDSTITDADPATAAIFSMFAEVSVKSVKSAIMASNSKTCPLDPFPKSLLKDCIDSLAPAIGYIVNASFSCGVFPSALKHGHVTLILKKNGLDPEVFKNYRPITNLPFLSKVLEKCTLSQMYSYLLQNDLFPASQSAYRKDNSTETALLRITNDILQATDKLEDTILVLLDLSAAFDTIDHGVIE